MKKKEVKEKVKCKTCRVWRKALIHECEEANILAEFIRIKGLDAEYCQWSKDKFIYAN
jgi:hypothetical protein